MYVIKGQTADWEVVVGLEVHCQIISKSKLFSSSSTEFGAAPNTQVSFIDSAMPGMLPVLNQECVNQAIRTGLGLNAKINNKSVFARKNYFYADLPQGYQISQLAPLVGEGYLEILDDDGNPKKVRIERLHVEQDAGKSVHDASPTQTYIDLNRVGTGLMEIVSYPDISSPSEAGQYVKKIRQIVRALGTCDGNMEEGSMRADVNVSVRKVGEQGYRTRCEVKNMNSFKFIQQAIEYEAKRQVEAHEAGEKIVQSTLQFDKATGETSVMRSKEDAHDYRYFPEPDLAPLIVTDELIEELRKTLPELPDAKKKRFMSEYQITDFDATLLTSEEEISTYYEKTVGQEKIAKGKTVANWMTGELFAYLNKSGLDFSQNPISSQNLSQLVDRILDKTISGNIAKKIWEMLLEIPTLTPDEIIEKEGLKQITDTGAIEKAVDDVIANNPDKVAEIKAGKDKLIGWLTGQVMQITGGKANPAMVQDLLKKKLL